MAFDKDACSAMTAAGTSGISDAMERLGLPRTVLTGFQCSVASGFAVAGTAFTVRQVPKHHPAQKDQRLVRHGEVSADLAQPGDFVVIDAGGRTDIAGWGENHSRRCQTRGLAAVLVNGATRDSAAIRRIGFPVFHLGTSPISSRWDQETADLNGLVVVAGVQIRAGDVIIGDEDGVVVIDPALVATIVAELQSWAS